jgi:hypothetical protein
MNDYLTSPQPKRCATRIPLVTDRRLYRRCAIADEGVLANLFCTLVANCRGLADATSDSDQCEFAISILAQRTIRRDRYLRVPKRITRPDDTANWWPPFRSPN